MFSRIACMTCGLLGGAAAMFFFDPVAGRRRRHILRDKTMSKYHKAQRAVEVVTKDIHNRLEGFKAGDFSPSKLDLFQQHWSPATRAIVGTAAMLVLMTAVKRGRFLSLGFAALSLYEALTNESMMEHRHNGHSMGQTVQNVAKSVMQSV